MHAQKNSYRECTGNEVLTLAGKIDVVESETEKYCEEKGCGDWTKNVLDCIRSVKRDFRFANNAKVDIIYNAITDGCKSLSGTHYINLQTVYS